VQSVSTRCSIDHPCPGTTERAGDHLWAFCLRSKLSLDISARIREVLGPCVRGGCWHVSNQFFIIFQIQYRQDVGSGDVDQS